MAALSGVFPLMYNTTEQVRSLATKLTLIIAAFMPFNAYSMVIYFTIRSGGKVFTTVFYDSISLWLFAVPPVFLLSRLTNIGIIPLFFVGHIIDIVKTVLGVYLLRKGDWIRNLVRK
jgi:Na+-driven multidrug efflux pump